MNLTYINRSSPLTQCVLSLLCIGHLTACHVIANDKPVSTRQQITQQSSQLSSQGIGQQQSHLQALEWVKTADVTRDAQHALKRGDYRLFIQAGRGGAILGLPIFEQPLLKKRCRLQYIPGTTDVVKGHLHFTLLQQAHEYAVAYNRLVAPACIDKP